MSDIAMYDFEASRFAFFCQVTHHSSTAISQFFAFDLTRRYLDFDLAGRHHVARAQLVIDAFN